MDEAEIRRGLDRAYRALAQKERTVAEMRELLLAKVAEEAAEEVLAELIDTGALNDAEFAKGFTADKRALSGWGNERIREALRDRGIDRADIEAALSDDPGGGEIERALSLLEGRNFDLTLERDRARALGLLARRGYESEVAYDAIRRLETGHWLGR